MPIATLGGIEPDSSQPVLILAGALVDAAFCFETPGALLLGPRSADGRTVLAVGPVDRVREAARGLEVPPRLVDRSGCVVVPAFVNSHCHLDLTLLGPMAADAEGGFTTFVERVRNGRPNSGEGIRAAVAEGIRLSLAGGVVAVGDIAGAASGIPRLEPLRTLRASPLAGISFIEFFAIGRGESSGLARLAACLNDLDAAGSGPSLVRAGISPHATNTVSIDAYRHTLEIARSRSMPLMTHAAETAEEREFISDGTGPHRAFLERIHLWDDSLLQSIGRGRSPIAHLAPILASQPMSLVHVNDADKTDIATIAASGSSVIYCPRASSYFGAPQRFGPHPYADLRAAGVTVALGTDSIINLDRADRITPFDDAALLVRRDELEPRAALGMLTADGAAVLNLDPSGFMFSSAGTLRGCVAIAASNPESWVGIFRSEADLELLL